MRVAIIVNPRAGNGRGGRIAAQVSTALRARGVDHELLPCADGADPERLARAAAERGVAVVAALGGDGHVASVANGVAGTDAALAVIPAGTANDFARSMGLPWRDPLAAAAVLHEGAATIRRVDMGVVEVRGARRQYLNVAGAGFDSVVTARGERVRVLGRYRYLYATFETLVRFRPGVVRVTVDGGELREMPAMMVAVGNGPAYGGGMRVTPGAAYDDGMLEVCVIGALSRARFVRLFPSVFKGRHVDYDVVSIFRGTRVEISSDPVYEVFADGEFVGQTPASFSVLPGVLGVLVPVSG